MKHLQLKFEIKHENKNLDGTYRKLLDSSLAKKYGWKAKTSLEDGLGFAINDFVKSYIQNKKKWFNTYWLEFIKWNLKIK